MRLLALTIAATALTWGGGLKADTSELNIYSARHYQTDEALYRGFSEATGIKINRLELGDDPLLERLRAEGKRSPADVVLLVDATRLWRAQQDGLFQPVDSDLLRARIPAQYRADDGSWYGFSTRARVIIHDPQKVSASEVDTYLKLADPVNQGRLCTRSGSHPYNLSLFGAMLEHLGPDGARDWLAGMVRNMARSPVGGDTDQIRAVASGECAVAISNSYYWVRLLLSDKSEDREVVSQVRMLWPDQQGHGTHVNLAGAAVAAHAPNRAAAVQFLEYLASDQAQSYFAAGNNEWPVVADVKHGNPALEMLGEYKADNLSLDAIARRSPQAQKLLNEVGYR
jgi:iron(III) transport system substrate-binding protein